MTAGAGSERGQRPTGCSADASHAPGKGTEPAPVTLADPYGLPSPDDNGEVPPVSPPDEPDVPNGDDRLRLVLVDDDILWMLDPRRRVTIVQVAGGAL